MRERPGRGSRDFPEGESREVRAIARAGSAPAEGQENVAGAGGLRHCGCRKSLMGWGRKELAGLIEADARSRGDDNMCGDHL